MKNKIIHIISALTLIIFGLIVITSDNVINDSNATNDIKTEDETYISVDSMYCNSYSCNLESVSNSDTSISSATVLSTSKKVKKSGKKLYYYKNNKKVKKSGWYTATYFNKKVRVYVGKKGYITYYFTKASGTVYKYNGKKYVNLTKTLKKNSAKKLKKIGNKYYYIKKNGKISLTAGWKKKSGKYYCYVKNSNGVVSYKITNGKLKQWKNSKWVTLKTGKNYTKVIGGKCFFINKNGTVVTSSGWYSISSGDKFYITSTGLITYKISNNKLYKFTNGSYKVVTDTVTIGDTTYYVSSSGKITDTTTSSDSGSNSNTGSNNGSDSNSGSSSDSDTGSSSDDGEISAGTYSYNVGYYLDIASKWLPSYTTSTKYICTLDGDIFFTEEDIHNDYINNHEYDDTLLATTYSGFYGYDTRCTLDSLTFTESSTSTEFVTLDTVTYTITIDGDTIIYTYNGTDYGSEDEVRAVIEEEILSDCYFSYDVDLVWVSK